MSHACIPSSSDMLAEAGVDPAVGSVRASVIMTWQCAGLCLLLVDLSARVKKRSTHVDEAGRVHGWFGHRCSIFNTLSRLPLSIKQRGDCWQLYSYFGSLSVCLLGILQDVQGDRMEEDLLRLECSLLGREVLWCCPLYYNLCWFQEACNRGSLEDKQDSQADTRTGLVHMNPIFSILNGGILPFGAVFIDLFFVLKSGLFSSTTS
ncbi:unnamed protein product [Musa textilis]